MDNEIKALSDTLIGEIAFALGFSKTSSYMKNQARWGES